MIHLSISQDVPLYVSADISGSREMSRSVPDSTVILCEQRTSGFTQAFSEIYTFHNDYCSANTLHHKFCGDSLNNHLA